MTRPKNASDSFCADRRDFVRLSAATIAGAASSSLAGSRFVHAATPATSAETFVGELYASLSAEQKQAICRPFNDAARSRINANWHVTKTRIGDGLFSKQQQTLVDQIVRSITSEDGYQRLIRQMDDDDGGIDNYSVAIFGEPGTETFQWEMTGRHLTMRADGNRNDKAAFGGPIVYGHGEEEVTENLFYYQTQKANEVFRSLDSDQAKLALLNNAPSETAVQLKGTQDKFPGIGVDQLAADQKQLVEATLKVLLAPYRNEDVEEVMAILKNSGGFDQLHMAFYQDEDLEDDKVWDVWRVEGPSLVWHFRGAPHVHAYVNIGVIS